MEPQSAQGTFLNVTLGDSATFLWSIDDGAGLRGLTNPANIRLRDLKGVTQTQHTGTLHLSSDDSMSRVPPDLSFTSQSLVGHVFPVVFEAGGDWSLSATELESGIKSAPLSLPVPHLYRLGCDASTKQGTNPSLIGGLVFLAWLAISRRNGATG